MQLTPVWKWSSASALTILLAGCGGAKKEAYIEKPVDDLYNQAMDQMVEERYPQPLRASNKSKANILIRYGQPKPN